MIKKFILSVLSHLIFVLYIQNTFKLSFCHSSVKYYVGSAQSPRNHPPKITTPHHLHTPPPTCHRTPRPPLTHTKNPSLPLPNHSHQTSSQHKLTLILLLLSPLPHHPRTSLSIMEYARSYHMGKLIHSSRIHQKSHPHRTHRKRSHLK